MGFGAARYASTLPLPLRPQIENRKSKIENAVRLLVFAGVDEVFHVPVARHWTVSAAP